MARSEGRACEKKGLGQSGEEKRKPGVSDIGSVATASSKRRFTIDPGDTGISNNREDDGVVGGELL